MEKDKCPTCLRFSIQGLCNNCTAIVVLLEGNSEVAFNIYKHLTDRFKRQSLAEAVCPHPNK